MLTPGSVSAVLTAAGRQAFLDWILGASANRSPDSVWLALCYRVPGDNEDGYTMPEIPELWDDPNTPVTELTSTGYARVEYPFGAMPTDGSDPAWTPIPSGGFVNTYPITFPTAAGDWPVVTGWAMVDAQVGGTLLMYGANNLTVQAGDEVLIPEQSLVVSMAPLVV